MMSCRLYMLTTRVVPCGSQDSQESCPPASTSCRLRREVPGPPVSSRWASQKSRPRLGKEKTGGQEIGGRIPTGGRRGGGGREKGRGAEFWGVRNTREA